MFHIGFLNVHILGLIGQISLLILHEDNDFSLYLCLLASAVIFASALLTFTKEAHPGDINIKTISIV